MDEASTRSLDAFSTARLRASRLTADDFPEVHRFHRDARAMALLGGVRDEAQGRAYLERNLAHWDRYGFGLWLLRRSDADPIVGRACLRHLEIDGVDEVELGYGFYPEYWGQGLATEIALACVSLGFERLACPSLVALTRPDHLASQRVMAKAGLRFDRVVLHVGEPHVVFRRRGPPHDAEASP
jgi:RimJ/RimL family protein N-acetyltransferase